eukprot:RCo042314
MMAMRQLLRLRCCWTAGCRAGFLRSRQYTSVPTPPKDLGDECSMTFIIARTKESKTVVCRENQTLLEVARMHNIPLEGACEGACRCSTCHVHVQHKHLFEWLETNKPPTDEENDMLDQAFDLQPNSRLACQVEMKRALNGLVVRIPEATRNLAVDGYVPSHH